MQGQYTIYPFLWASLLMIRRVNITINTDLIKNWVLQINIIEFVLTKYAGAALRLVTGQFVYKTKSERIGVLNWFCLLKPM